MHVALIGFGHLEVREVLSNEIEIVDMDEDIVGAIGVSVARARRDVLFAGLAVVSFLLIEANAAWLGVSVVETRLAWRGG